MTPSPSSTRWPPPTPSTTTCPSSTRWSRRWPSATSSGHWWPSPSLTAAGFSPQQLTVDLVDHLRQGFLALVAPELVTVSGAERDALAAQAGRVGLAALVRAMEDLGRAQVAMRDAPDPRVNLEVALVRLVHPEADDSPGRPAGPDRAPRVLRSAGRGPTPRAPAGAPAPTPAPVGTGVEHGRRAGRPGRRRADRSARPGRAPPPAARRSGGAARRRRPDGRPPDPGCAAPPVDACGDPRVADAAPAVASSPAPAESGRRGAGAGRAASRTEPPVAAEPVAHPSEASAPSVPDAVGDPSRAATSWSRRGVTT